MSDIAQLIKRFENDIKHREWLNTRAKVGLSVAAETLLKMADRNLLTILAKYLRETPLSHDGMYEDLPMAWCILLDDIGHRLDIKPRPDKLNLPSWLDWATLNGQTAAAPAA